MASARVALAPSRLKVEHAAVDTTKPFVARDVTFILLTHAMFLSAVVALRIERSATRLSDAFERPALDYRGSCQRSAVSNQPENKGFALPSFLADRCLLNADRFPVPCGGFEPTLCGLKSRHPQANRRTGLKKHSAISRQPSAFRKKYICLAER